MTFRKHNNERLTDDRFHDEGLVARGKPQQARMDLAVAQHLELFARPEELKRELDSRMTLAKEGQQARKDVELGGRHVADDQLADLAPPGSRPPSRAPPGPASTALRRGRPDQRPSARLGDSSDGRD